MCVYVCVCVHVGEGGEEFCGVVINGEKGRVKVGRGAGNRIHIPL